MKKNIITISLIILFIAALVLMGYYFIKPKYDNNNKNPYDLKIDSIGQIDAEHFCSSNASTYNIPFNNSKAIAVDHNNNIYISGDSSILILEESGKVIRTFKTNKQTATALVVDNNNNIFAALVNQINIYSNKGELLKEFPIISEESYITSVAVNNNSIFMADASAALVYEYKKDGTYLNTFGTKSNKEEISSFILPSYYFDVAIAPDATIWIANTGKHKLVNFDSNAKVLSFWGETSSSVEGFCGCCNPSHFAIMKDGSFVTAEKGIVRVKKYDSKGNFQCAIAGPDTFKEASTGLDIAINSKNQILVLEPDAKEIHIFTLKQSEAHE